MGKPVKAVAVVLLTAMLAPLPGAAASESEAAKKITLVVAAQIEDVPEDRHLWAAGLSASRLKGNLEVLEGGLAAALKHSRANPGKVARIVEVMVDAYSWREEVRITCYNATGRSLWKEKAVANMGGSEESLARKMVDRALAKAEKRPACLGQKS